MYIVPTTWWRARNCRFLVDDVNGDWYYGMELHDLIRGSGLLGNVGDWPLLVKRAFSGLDTGGFLELGDRPFRYTTTSGAALDPNHVFAWVSREVEDFGRLTKHPFDLAPGKYTSLMDAAGFRNIQETCEAVPVTKCLDIILAQIRCVLSLKWKSKGVGDKKAEKEMERLFQELKSEANGVCCQ